MSMPLDHDDIYENSVSLLDNVANQSLSGGQAFPHHYGHAHVRSTNGESSYDSQYMGSIAAILDPQPPPYAPKEMSELEVLANGKVLLKHFRDIVVPQFAPIPMDSKSPWEILNWSSAIQTHADMTYLESHNVQHANKANLFAIIGCSAYIITRTQLCSDIISSQDATQILYYTSRQAKKHMQESLRMETTGAQKAKYKDQLMAIFSLIALAVSNI